MQNPHKSFPKNSFLHVLFFILFQFYLDISIYFSPFVSFRFFFFFFLGHGESSLRYFWSMVNLKRTCVLLFYYFLYLKVNLDLEKKSAWWIFTQLYFRGGESWPNYFWREVNWWWILTLRFCWKGEQRWRLEVGRFKMPFDACIKKYNFCEYVKFGAISWKFGILSISAELKFEFKNPFAHVSHMWV